MFKRLVLAVLLSLFISNLGFLSDRGEFNNCMVLSVKYPGFFSGSVISWYKIDILTKDNEQDSLYKMCIAGEKCLEIGHHYNIVYRISDVHGCVDYKGVSLKRVKVIQEFEEI